MSQENPKVSVIIPVYNTEKYLHECLDSVVNQTLKDIEIICVDDGSTDSSRVILREYAAKDDRVKVYTQEKSNAGAARNVGLSKATGEYLAFLDSDDYYELFMLEHMLACAQKRGADIVVCRYHTYYESTGKTSHSCWGVKMGRLPSKIVFSYHEIEQECFSSIMGCPWNKLFKRKLVTENKLRFQEQPVFNDAFFSYSAMISTNALTVLDESLICYRSRASSDSITDRRSQYMDCSYKLLRELKKFLVYSGVYEKYEQHFINYTIRLLYADYTAKNRSQEAKREMSEKIRNWLDEFQVNGHERDYYFDLAKYKELLQSDLNQGSIELAKDSIAANPEDLIIPEGYTQIVPIVFSTNEKYTPYAGVAIQSILEHTSPEHFYRIYVLHSRLSDNMVRLLEAQSTQQCSIQCLNVDTLIQFMNIPLLEKAHFSKEMYYRFIIPEVLSFYPYVVYLDCDLIVERDIADIIPDSMGDKLIAAVRNPSIESRKEELSNWFQLNPDDYFNSGVHVFNVAQWKAEKTEEKCFAVLQSIPPQKLRYPDQDILNIVCQNRVLFLDEAWNYYWHMIYGGKNLVALCKPITDRIGENFYILHFVSPVKPWSSPERAHSWYFWKYARHSIFYEIILKENLAGNTSSAKRKASQESYQFFIPSKLRGGIQCYRDHGVGYTVRRTLYHMGLWEDEEAPKGPENRPKLVKHAERILHKKKGK